ncbi:MAG: hypothetical protein HZC51_02470 [Nitrospirae bacterium]|nr:hypothetical protein [Nitrospirota bacterium]
MKEEEKTSGDRQPEAKPKVVAKKRKKKVLLVCDRTCRTCRTNCDTPFFPDHINKGNK